MSDSDDKQYLAKFRQGSSPMAMNAIDFYIENGEIIEHKWAMGGESKKIVESVPDKIDGYERIYQQSCEDGMKKENDIAVLELSIKKLSEAFDEFVGACVDENGKPKAPDYKAIMKAKAYLPKYCTNAFNKK